MKIREIKPTVDADALLAGAQFADAFGLEVDGHALDARQAAERMIGRAPRWIDALMSLRNILVAPFGLKTSGASATTPRDMIGIFPVISQTPDRLVAGFNDMHLDFRVVVDVATAWRRPAGHRDHAGQDAQLARADLSRDHPAVSPARRPRHAAAGRGPEQRACHPPKRLTRRS